MVQAIDLQDNLSKAPLVARLQHVQQTRADFMQFHLNRQETQKQILEHSRTGPIAPVHPATMRLDIKSALPRPRYTRRRAYSLAAGQDQTSTSEDRPHRIDLIA